MATVSEQSQPRPTILSAILRGALWGVFLAAVFMAGFWVRGMMPASLTLRFDAAQAQQNVGNYPLLTQVQSLLNENYLRDQPPQSELEFEAARGLVASLKDRFTFMIVPPVAQSEADVLTGKYGGIGVQVQRNEAGDFVLYPFPNGPAAREGVKDGDVLIKVNGEVVAKDMAQDAVDQLLRGEVKPNSGVEITVRRAPNDEEKSFTVLFEEIEIPSVVWRVLQEDSNIGYVQIIRFTNRTPTEVREGVLELAKSNVKALVLDVRNNPGGLLQESIDVAGLFLDGGTVAYERNRKTGEKSFTVDASMNITKLPMVVLINKNTASAAEIVSGALKDRKRAMLIGQQSYGKGSVQLIFPLLDKSALHVTSSEWLSPDKYQIDGKGIEPDIPMIPAEDGRDVELGEAIRQLQKQVAGQ